MINFDSKKSICLIFVFWLLHFINSSKIYSQKLVDDSVFLRLDRMYLRDQNQRQIMLGEKKWKAFKNLPQAEQDSIWKIIKESDSVNWVEFLDILKNYGYISKGPNGKPTIFGTILLHNIKEKRIKEIDSILLHEIKMGRMPPLDYAKWYDRYLLQTCGKKRLYGEYAQINKFPCVEDINLTNEARKKIGLKPIKKSVCD